MEIANRLYAQTWHDDSKFFLKSRCLKPSRFSKSQELANLYYCVSDRRNIMAISSPSHCARPQRTSLTSAGACSHLDKASGDLNSRIAAAIKPWRKSTEKPPFKIEELVIMAIVMCPEPATFGIIIDWILVNFTFYRNLATKIGSESLFNRNGGNSLDLWEDLEKPFSLTFEYFDIPIESGEACMNKPAPCTRVGCTTATECLNNIRTIRPRYASLILDNVLTTRGGPGSIRVHQPELNESLSMTLGTTEEIGPNEYLCWFETLSYRKPKPMLVRDGALLEDCRY